MAIVWIAGQRLGMKDELSALGPLAPYEFGVKVSLTTTNRDRGRPGRAPGAPGAPGLERGVGGGVSGQLRIATILTDAGCVCARAPAVASDPGAPGAPGAGGVFWPPTAPFVPGATGAPTAFTPARPVALGLVLKERLT
jgi:hypothetical protein